MSLSDDGGYGGDSHRGPETGQTRTRLPDNDGDIYGPGRRSRTGLSSRNLVTIVGVIVLLLAAIAFANRGGSGNSETTANDSPKDPGHTQPTAPTGTKAVDGKTGGIASGFAKTEQGAQSAAANYVVALSSSAMYKSDERDTIVDAVYTSSAAAARKESLRKVYTDPKFLGRVGLKPDGSTPGGMTFVSRANPVGTKTEKFEGTTATVAVWYSTLFGLAGTGSQNPVAESWYTSTMQLQWVSGDWKVAGFTQKAGPAPIGGDQAAATAKDMSKAVQGFGGFTYAR
ncbi:hypothetical protein CP981_22450 [Streptomyces platensis]|uniref:DUF8175 domain-containing protein n=2 Tax=Streptomyces TaxID=1883 RepID=A0AAE6TR50_STRPT|nr:MULTISPECIES: hypothetical protein [Streptomyces]OSY37382.1 hypothetical protein BG653_06531 [Streptomyces platensis]QEV54033.1 hypothetical protein CP981_22450 [Streptomyces platensis]GFE15147.1 hypothetical protein Sgleb_31940 [Streptomyces glebosus]GHG88994.1 hypothetical protein GCM10010513_71490 [Streptomyces glebosus]